MAYWEGRARLRGCHRRPPRRRRGHPTRAFRHCRLLLRSPGRLRRRSGGEKGSQHRRLWARFRLLLQGGELGVRVGQAAALPPRSCTRCLLSLHRWRRCRPSWSGGAPTSTTGRPRLVAPRLASPHRPGPVGEAAWPLPPPAGRLRPSAPCTSRTHATCSSSSSSTAATLRELGAARQTAAPPRHRARTAPSRRLRPLLLRRHSLSPGPPHCTRPPEATQSA